MAISIILLDLMRVLERGILLGIHHQSGKKRDQSQNLRKKKGLQIDTINERMMGLTDRMKRKENSSGRMGWFKERSSIDYILKLRNPREI